MHEVAAHAKPCPEGAEVPEHHLPLGRLAEQTHVRDAPMCDQVARSRRVAAVVRPLSVSVLRLLDFAAVGRDDHVSGELLVLERADRGEVAGERTLHVRDAEPPDPPVALDAGGLEALDALRPGLATGIRRVEVTVEHQRLAATCSGTRGEDVRSAFLDLLELHRQAERTELARDPFGQLLLLAGEARYRHGIARPADEPSRVDRAHRRRCGRTRSPKSRICSCRRSPQSSSITCVQPESRYSSIASMQSSGVPAIGLHLSSSASLTSAFAASRPPRSIASATGRISSCSIPARSSSVSAAPWMFCTLFARYMPAISRAPSRPASRSDAWIDATIVQPMSMSDFTLSFV